MKLGLPSYTNTTNKVARKNYFKLKSGDNFYRILPPCFSLADAGKWAIYYAVHFGYRGSPKATGATPPFRPFVCVQKFGRDRSVTQSCAEHTKNAVLAKTLEDKRKELTEKGKSADEIKNTTAPLANYLMEHNLDRKWHLNVKAMDGSMGCLKIPHRAYTDLIETIKTVREKYGVDPISAEGGIWFNLKRTGVKWNEIAYKVEVVMEMVTTPQGVFETIKKAPLTQEDINRMETECFDLSAMYTTISPEQVQMLVETEGDPSIVDKVFAKPSVNEAFEPEIDPDQDDEVIADVSIASKVGKMSMDEFKAKFS